jgi:hypothetical protein
MELDPYVERLQRQLALAAEAGGDEARTLAERLMLPLDAAVRLTLQEALAAAAEEITCELAPGSVELRLRGREPEFVVTPPPTEPADDGNADEGAVSDRTTGAAGADGVTARINVRMPDQLKTRVEQAAAHEGLSVNAWLVRAALAAVERGDPARPRARRPSQGGQRYTGWAR